MALDSRFIIASDLQSLFRNKDTGLPLRNGVIYFWSDPFRTVPKEVYKLSGSPPNYGHVSIGSTVTLTAAGTMSDNENPANDIILYYFPYDGTPEETNGTVELYYVEVYSEGGKTSGVLQFTREGWPNFVTDEGNVDNILNYIPNGQFKIHTNIPADPEATPPKVAGEIRQGTTVLAQGGWSFERPADSNAKDIVLFQSFGGYVPIPSASPEYFIQIQNQSPDAGDNRKDLCIQFDDVNKFVSATQVYTYAFAGKSNSGNINASLILIKDYGSAGSPSEEIALDDYVITNNYEVHQTNNILFHENSGKTITAGNNIKLALRLPLDSLFSVSLTNFILTPGSQPITEFPQTTDSEFAYESITPAIPDYDSKDLYLPPVLTPQGLGYSHADIGKIFACMYEMPNIGELLCDGSQYETDAYSNHGIPYSRLQAVLYNTTTHIPRFGTGANYFTAYISAVSALLRIATNKVGSTTDASDGTPATGFNINTIHTGDIYGFNAYVFDSAKMYIVNTLTGATGNPTNGSSPFTTQLIRQGDSLNQIVEVSVTAAAALSGLWFGVSSTIGNFYIWFKVDGAGTDPAIGGRTGIEIDLDSGNTAEDVAAIIAEALMGQQLTTVAMLAGNVIPPGSYFNISTASPTSVDYYVWYTQDGIGTDPKPPGKKSIGPVPILSADTANQVAVKTQQIINQKFFAVPDLRGVFLRGWENTANVDPSVNFRGSTVNSTLYGNQIGTYQFDDFMSHLHVPNTQTVDFYTSRPPPTGRFSTSAGNDMDTDHTTSLTGGPETRPVNVYVNYVIKY